MRAWFPIALVVAGASMDAAGADGLAFYVSLVLVPVTAACALASLGDLLDRRAAARAGTEDFLQPLFYGLALLLLVSGAAAGAVAIAFSGCLAVFSVQALVGVATELRRPAIDLG